MSDYMEYAEYYKKAWEHSLKERTNELQAEIQTLRAENARYREALESVLESEVLKQAPFVGYSEAVANAREALKEIGE